MPMFWGCYKSVKKVDPHVESRLSVGILMTQKLVLRLGVEAWMLRVHLGSLTRSISVRSLLGIKRSTNMHPLK